MPREDIGPRLISDAERIAEAFGDDQNRPVALTLQQGVGRDGGTHLDDLDRTFGDRFACADADQVANTLQGRVFVLLRIFRQQLVRRQLPVRGAPHEVREGAAPVDPDVPAGGGFLLFGRCHSVGPDKMKRINVFSRGRLV